MTFVPIDNDIHCTFPCDDHKIISGLCSCHNNIINKTKNIIVGGENILDTKKLINKIMENKIYKERHIFFETEQKVIISENETNSGIILNIKEGSGNNSFLLYLTYEESRELAKEILSFEQENRK